MASERSGKFTVDISERQHDLEMNKNSVDELNDGEMSEVAPAAFKPTKDNFVNFMSYHAGLLSFEQLLTEADLKEVSSSGPRLADILDS